MKRIVVHLLVALSLAAAFVFYHVVERRLSDLRLDRPRVKASESELAASIPSPAAGP